MTFSTCFQGGLIEENFGFQNKTLPGFDKLISAEFKTVAPNSPLIYIGR